MAQVVGLPIGRLMFMFLAYLAIHIGIGIMLNKKRQELDTNYKETTQRDIKVLELWFKWFPALAVIICLILFYII